VVIAMLMTLGEVTEKFFRGRPVLSRVVENSHVFFILAVKMDALLGLLNVHSRLLGADVKNTSRKMWQFSVRISEH